jgi:hypothetical protein
MRSPLEAKKQHFLKVALSYVVLNRGDGGVGPRPSLLFALWLTDSFLK